MKVNHDHATFFHDIAKLQVEFVGLFLTWLLYDSNFFGDLLGRQHTWPERERERRVWKETYDQWFFQMSMEMSKIEADTLAREMLTNLGIREFP